MNDIYDELEELKDQMLANEESEAFRLKLENKRLMKLYSDLDDKLTNVLVAVSYSEDEQLRRCVEQIMTEE